MTEDEMRGRAFILGGNASTLAFTASFRPENRQLSIWLVPLAWTPIGVVLGDAWQRVNVAADNIGGWTDETFAPDDDRSFVTSLRDAELLVRIGWSTVSPTTLDEKTAINPDDIPDDVMDALAMPAESLTTCQVCRRTCVRDHFVWNERQMCAWDYHALVFGKRGPWRTEPYEERLWETIPQPAYVSPALLDEANVDIVMTLGGIEETRAHRLIDDVMSDGGGAHLAARTSAGLSLLRERPRSTPA